MIHGFMSYLKVQNTAISNLPLHVQQSKKKIESKLHTLISSSYLTGSFLEIYTNNQNVTEKYVRFKTLVHKLSLVSLYCNTKGSKIQVNPLYRIVERFSLLEILDFFGLWRLQFIV